jgi:hypothetical protein
LGRLLLFLINMDLTFKELKCPKCGEALQQGSITISTDVQMVKRCTCDFWMILVIPHKDYNYTIKRTHKDKDVELNG